MRKDTKRLQKFAAAAAVSALCITPVTAQAAVVTIPIIGGTGSKACLEAVRDKLEAAGIDVDALLENCFGNGSGGVQKPETEAPEKPETETPEQPETETPGETEEDKEESQAVTYAERIVELVNIERKKAGLAPVTLSKELEAAALIRTREIEISFSHTRPNGSYFTSVLTENGISYRLAGENIAWGQKSPEQVMQAWMNSPGHRANILNANFTELGVGYYQNARGVNYFVQLFKK